MVWRKHPWTWDEENKVWIKRTCNVTAESWKCPKCPYSNVGPICTKCGYMYVPTVQDNIEWCLEGVPVECTLQRLQIKRRILYTIEDAEFAMFERTREEAAKVADGIIHAEGYYIGTAIRAMKQPGELK